MYQDTVLEQNVEAGLIVSGQSLGKIFLNLKQINNAIGPWKLIQVSTIPTLFTSL